MPITRNRKRRMSVPLLYLGFCVQRDRILKECPFGTFQDTGRYIHIHLTCPQQQCKEGGKEKCVNSEPSTGWFLWGWKVSQDELQQLWSVPATEPWRHQSLMDDAAIKMRGVCNTQHEDRILTHLFVFCWIERRKLTQGLASKCCMKLQNLLCEKHNVAPAQTVIYKSRESHCWKICFSLCQVTALSLSQFSTRDARRSLISRKRQLLTRTKKLTCSKWKTVKIQLRNMREGTSLAQNNNNKKNLPAQPVIWSFELLQDYN